MVYICIAPAMPKNLVSLSDIFEAVIQITFYKTACVTEFGCANFGHKVVVDNDGRWKATDRFFSLRADS